MKLLSFVLFVFLVANLGKDLKKYKFTHLLAANHIASFRISILYGCWTLDFVPLAVAAEAIFIAISTLWDPVKRKEEVKKAFEQLKWTYDLLILSLGNVSHPHSESVYPI